MYNVCVICDFVSVHLAQFIYNRLISTYISILDLFVVILQIGAIYLWSYVYNIVRLSSRRITIESGGKDISRESSTSDLGSCTEPLLSSTKEYSICEVPKEYSIIEDHEEQHSVPCARTVTKSKVVPASYLWWILCFLCELLLILSSSEVLYMAFPCHNFNFTARLTKTVSEPNLRNSCAKLWERHERAYTFTTTVSEPNFDLDFF